MNFLTVTNIRRRGRWDFYTENERAGCSTHIACMTSFLFRGGRDRGEGRDKRGRDSGGRDSRERDKGGRDSGERDSGGKRSKGKIK
jgi:hypothetical protein